MLADPFNLASPDFSISDSGSASAVDAGAIESWFDATDYVGAVGDTDWTSGWTTSERN